MYGRRTPLQRVPGGKEGKPVDGAAGPPPAIFFPGYRIKLSLYIKNEF
jgi:hypothetical protein